MREELKLECGVAGCHKPVARGALCWGHVKRRQRHQVVASDLRDRGLEPFQRVMEAFFDLTELDATDRRAWDAAYQRLRVYIRRYTQSHKQPNQYTKGQRS